MPVRIHLSSRPICNPVVTSWLTALLTCTACSDQLEGATPALTAHSLDPTVVCADQRATILTLQGEHFSPVPASAPAQPYIALPSVTLSRSAALDGAPVDAVELQYSGDPEAPSNTSLLSWQDQTHLQFTIDQALSIAGQTSSLPSGIYAVSVSNPRGARTAASAQLAIVGKPAITSISPALLCLSQHERELTLTGTGMLRLEQSRPSIQVGPSSDAGALEALEDCSAVAQAGADAELCRSARISLGMGALDPGLHTVRLTNPEPADCHTDEDLTLRVVGAPVISELPALVVCGQDDRPRLTVRGENFLRIDGVAPEVQLGGRVFEVSAMSGCEDLQAPGAAVERCEQLELEAELSVWPAGNSTLEVTNPAPAGCSASARGGFRIAAMPTISVVDESPLCIGLLRTLTVTGSGFDRGATVRLDDTEATVQFVSDTRLHVSVSGLPVGSHTLSVHNAGSCTASVPVELQVGPCNAGPKPR